MKYKALFCIIFTATTLWMQLSLFVSGIGKDKPLVRTIEDKNITQLVLEKTGVKIDTILLSESSRPFAAMVGIPGRPQLILSQSLYHAFSHDQLEYVLLHEIGHNQLQHTVVELILGSAFLMAGIKTLKKYPALPLSVALGVLCGIAMIQVGRIYEVQADQYALVKIENPQGMMSASQAFKNYYDNHGGTPTSISRLLFFRGNPYESRIRMAEDEIKRRAGL